MHENWNMKPTSEVRFRAMRKHWNNMAEEKESYQFDLWNRLPWDVYVENMELKHETQTDR